MTKLIIKLKKKNIKKFKKKLSTSRLTWLESWLACYSSQDIGIKKNKLSKKASKKKIKVK
jgi:hypothetical protein